MVIATECRDKKTFFVFKGCVSHMSIGSWSFSEKEKVGLFVKLISVSWVPWAVTEDHPPVGKGVRVLCCSAEVQGKGKCTQGTLESSQKLTDVKCH